MSVIGQIPLPKTGMQAFEDSRSQSIKDRLMQAQAQESTGKASQSNMLANLINMAMGGVNQNPQQSMNQLNNQIGNESGNRIIPPINQNNSSDKQKNAMDWLQRLGYINPTAQEKSDIDVKSAFNKEMSANDIKQNAKWNDVITASEEMQPVLDNIQKITANPVFQDMFKNPQYLGYDIKYLKRMGTPEQIKYLTELGTNAKSIYSALGQEFKGAFREFEKKIFDKVAVDEEHDTLPAMQAKINTLMQLRSLVSQRLSLADNIFRSSEGKISPSSSLKIASKQISSDKIAKEVYDQYSKFEKEQSKSNKEESHKKIPYGYTPEKDIGSVEPENQVNNVTKWSIVDGQLVEGK